MKKFLKNRTLFSVCRLEFILKVIYNLSTKHTNKIWKCIKTFYLSIKAISTSGSENGMFGYLLLRPPLKITPYFEQARHKLICYTASSPTTNLRHRDNVTGGMGILPIFCHVDTNFDGIEMISIRNGNHKCAELSDWLCLGFSKLARTDLIEVFLRTFGRKNEICMKRANHVAILQPFPRRS